MVRSDRNRCRLLEVIKAEVMKKNVCMIAYARYSIDARLRREAETLVSNNRHKVIFLVPKENDTPRRYDMNGVHVAELNANKYKGKSKVMYILSYLRFLTFAFIGCSGLFLTHKIDVVHVHNMPNFLVFAALIPRLFGKKLILDIHDSVPETFGAKFDQKSSLLFKLLCLEESLCCRLAQKIICVNHLQRETLIQRGIPADKIVVSMNVPDHWWFHGNGQNKRKTKSLRNFNLVYHGTLAKRLGIDLTIAAIPMIIDKIPDLKFYVFGEGDDADDFKALTKKLGLRKYVHFTDFVPAELLVSVLEGMHLGVVSNRKNMATDLMLPVKMLEYIALNIPVVVPRLKTIQFYFDDDMVHYFGPGSVDSLAEAILEAFYNRATWFKKTENARRFLKKYGWEIHKRDFLNLYNSLS